MHVSEIDQPPRVRLQAVVAETSQPMSFAILRNAHEAFRTSVRLQQQALRLGDMIGFRAEWRSFRRTLAVHVAMEDHALFAMLDEVGAGAIGASYLADERVDDERFAARVDVALGAGSASSLHGVWTVWKGMYLRHLAHEEEVVVPLMLKAAPTPQARARVVHEHVISPTEHLPDFDASVGWVVQRLNEYGSTAQPPEVATRAFSWGLHHACSRRQWARLGPVVQRHCTPAIWADLVARCGVDGQGAID